jgi:hypothetical protein
LNFIDILILNNARALSLTKRSGGEILFYKSKGRGGFILVQPVLEQVHIHPDFCLGHLGIEHGGANLGMAQHFADCLDRDAIHQSDRCRESVAGKVESQVFLNSADFSEDLQTAVYLLIAHPGEDRVPLAGVIACEFSKIAWAGLRRGTFTGVSVLALVVFIHLILSIPVKICCGRNSIRSIYERPV